ncbi:MAG: glutamyl-tRNA reductase [Rhodospirillales bacterium]
MKIKKNYNLNTKTGLFVIGANHRSSSMSLRDKLKISKPKLPQFFDRLRKINIGNAIILSSIDITDIIFLAPVSSAENIKSEIIKLFAAHADATRAELTDQTYTLINRDAVRHLFSVISAIDAVLIGDNQILSDFKQAHQHAYNYGMSNNFLDQLVLKSEEVAKHVFIETEINRRPVSISAAAVKVARDLFGVLSKSTCLLVGSGEMGEMLASSMRSAGLRQLIVSHPSSERANRMGQRLNCHIGKMENLVQLISKSDIILTSMNSRHFSLDVKILEKAIKTRRRRPIFIIDTGVPGDVDPSVENINDIFLYTINNLEKVTREGTLSRTYEIEKAQRIIDIATNEVDINNMVKQEILQYQDLESLRLLAVKESNGDPEKATKLLLDKIKNNQYDGAN